MGVYTLFLLVSVLMTLLNIATDKGMLTVATYIFSWLCLLNLLLARYVPRYGIAVSSSLFMAEIVVLFTYFIISGNPDGFSVLWICMLPASGMLLFGRRRTTALCALMLLILLFFFRTGLGGSLLQYSYSETFRMRFPILFTSFYLLSLLLELISYVTRRELDKLREQRRYLYTHDYLTGALNRYGLSEWQKAAVPREGQTALMLDIDFFKQVNDSYGHAVGDEVLAAVSAEVREAVGTQVCRWGGEEFVVWYPEADCPPDMAERLRRTVEDMRIPVRAAAVPLRVTISVGQASGSAQEELGRLIDRADKCLYAAKEAGRNRVVRESDLFTVSEG